jgi:hypothetical protein
LANYGNKEEWRKTEYQKENYKFIANAHRPSPMVAQGAGLKVQGTNKKNIGARIQKPGDLSTFKFFWLL